MQRSPRNSLPIAIAGGGIGGLACALALAQRNFAVTVCERAAEFGQVGVGLQVAPNALSVLDALGVGDRVKKDALLIERLLMMDALSGETICDIPCGEAFRSRFGNPYAVSHRADVHGALLDACRAEPLISLLTSSAIEDFESDHDKVEIRLTSKEWISASALIGADGVRSRVRQILLDDGEPQAIGAFIYRALVPAAAMPKSLQKPFPTLWTGPDGHLIYYPVRGWSDFNVAATVLQPGANFQEGETDIADAATAFDGWNEVPLSAMRLSSRYQRYIIRQRDAVGNWTVGPVTLLGDAAHPMAQYIAQGAAMALEDVVCLADALDKADGKAADAFQSYQAIRIVRSARVQISSLMMDRIYHPRGVERLVRNSIFAGRTSEEYYDRLAWLFTPPSYVGRSC